MLGIDPKIARTAWAHAAIYAAVLLCVGVVWVIRKTLLVFATALMLGYLLFPFVEALDRRFSWKSRTPAVAPALPAHLCFDYRVHPVGQGAAAQ